MSQSDAHRALVMQVAARIESSYPQARVVVDVQQHPGDPVPPVVGGYRPDVHATLPGNPPSLLIAEAKTEADLETSHSEMQIAAFVGHLERGDGGVFVLAVAGASADRAKTMLRFARQNGKITRTKLVVFDGLDCWMLDPDAGRIWRLS